MKIVSKFSDYYDCIMKIGMDKTIVYNRKEETFPLSGEDMKDLNFSKYTHGNKFEENMFIVGFCGEIYPVASISWEEKCDPYIIKNFTEIYSRTISKYFYSQEDYFNFKNTSKIFKKILPYRIGNIGNRFFNLKNIFEYNWSYLKKYFDKYKTPIFVIRYNDLDRKEEIVINSELRKYEFFKIKDTYTAFQDIQMYISGVLGVGQPELVQIGNKEMIQKKGFNKWSFRKMPEGKK